MSLGRTVFGRMLAGLYRKVRSYEDTGAEMVKNWKTFRRFTLYAVCGYSTAVLFQHRFIEWTAAEGSSMFPTMQEKTPITLVNKRCSKGRNMQTGDIVNFTSPIFRDQNGGKRVIGIGGDYIVLDPHQAPSVGGAPVAGVTDWRSQAEIEKGVELKEREEPMMIEVPEGHMYVVGDNMSWSRDSRFFGALPMALVRGKQIAHVSGGMLTGWQWTFGDQLRKIPKEKEEEYLRSWRQNQNNAQETGVQAASSASTKQVD